VTVLHPQNGSTIRRQSDDGGGHCGRRRTRLFAALGDNLGQGRWSVRLQYKPLIRYVWLGAILIALGGADCGTRPALSRTRGGKVG
jgi:cytochrome c-type biogenesis protein CcmF